MGLPEPSYYSLAEIADRWQATTEHLLRLAEDGALEICAKPWADGSIRGWFVEAGHFDEEHSVPESRCLLREPHPIDTGALRSLQYCGEALIEWLPAPPGRYLRVLGLDGSNDEYPEIGMPDLCVRREERERFERQHGLCPVETDLARQGPWPWGDHETELLRHLKAAAEKWWARYDPADPSTAHTNEEVTAWLEVQGVSKRVAEIMAQILRADGLRTGPRR